MFEILLIVIGVFAGFLSGLLGIGGGLVFIPILFYMFTSQGVANPAVYAVATSLFCVILVSASSTIKHIQQKNFSLKESAWIGGFGAIGTYFGKQITTSDQFSEKEFAVIFAGILLYTAYSFLKSPKKNVGHSKPPIEVKWSSGLLVGGLGGFVAALTGLGGGIVMVPMLNFIYHKPFNQVVSLSSAAIFIISIAAVVQYSFSSLTSTAISSVNLGYVDFGVGLPLAVGGMLGAGQGAKYAMTVNKALLKRIFAGLAIFEAIRLLAAHLLDL